MNRFNFVLGSLLILSASLASAGVGSIGSPLLQDSHWQELSQTGELLLTGDDPDLENRKCEVGVSQMTFDDESTMSIGMVFWNKASFTTGSPKTKKTKTGYQIRLEETAMPRYSSVVTIDTDLNGKPLKVHSFHYDLLRFKLHKGECVIK